MIGYEILNLGTFFIVGSLLALLKFDSNSFKFFYFLGALVLLFLSLYYNFYSSVKHIVFPVIILFLGFEALPYISSFGRYGDPSYGIYIYSFPLQQALMYYCNLKTYDLLFWSCLLSIAFGYMSWHFVEKKALKFKI